MPPFALDPRRGTLPPMRRRRPPTSLRLACALALLATTRCAPPPRAVAPAPAPAPPSSGAASLPPLAPLDLRIVPVNERDEPVRCVDDRGTRACDLELVADGRVFDRFHSAVAAGRLGADWKLVSERTGRVVQRIRPDDRALIGTGPWHEQTPEAQVLFCTLTPDDALDCVHRFDPVRLRAGQIWNATSCGAKGDRWIASVDRGEIRVRFAGRTPTAPRVVAHVEPPALDANARRAALVLFALHVIEGETRLHLPSDPE